MHSLRQAPTYRSGSDKQCKNVCILSDRLRLTGVDQINSARMYAFSQTGSDLIIMDQINSARIYAFSVTGSNVTGMDQIKKTPFLSCVIQILHQHERKYEVILGCIQ
jgi:aerobic-type carbon monoxide dehydrogenase small subunit (CoxS/CutS family)